MSNDPLSINVGLLPVKYRSAGPCVSFAVSAWRRQRQEEAQEANPNAASHPLIREQMGETGMGRGAAVTWERPEEMNGWLSADAAS